MTNEHWKTIPGWFDFMAIYDKAVQDAQEGDIFVECGTWLGRSTCYLAQKIKESGKKIQFFSCDLYVTPKEEAFLKVFTKESFWEEFLDNLQKQDVLKYVTPYIGDSIQFAQQFKDKSVSFLFLDDYHETQHLKDEIISWYPKMKENGIMAGHDVGAETVLIAVRHCSKLFDTPFTLQGSPSWIMPMNKESYDVDC